MPSDGHNAYEVLVVEVMEGVEADTPGFRPVTPGVVEWLQGASTDRAEADWFISRLVPHPELTNLQRLRLGNPAAAALPRAFILCMADKDLQADPPTDSLVLAAERARSDRNWRVVELDANHLVNLNDPQTTVEVLLSLVDLVKVVPRPPGGPSRSLGGGLVSSLRDASNRRRSARRWFP